MKIIKIYILIIFSIFLSLFLIYPAEASEWKLKMILDDKSDEDSEVTARINKIYVDDNYIYGIGLEDGFIYIWYKSNMSFFTKLSQPFIISAYADNDYIYAVTEEISNLTVWYKNNMSKKTSFDNLPFFFTNVYVDDDYVYGSYGWSSVRVWYKDNLTFLMDLVTNQITYSVYFDENYIYAAGGDINIWYRNNMTLAKTLTGMGYEVYSDDKYIYGTNNKNIFVIFKNNFTIAKIISNDYGNYYGLNSIHIDDNYLYGVHSNEIYVWYKNNLTLSNVISDNKILADISDIYINDDCIYAGVPEYVDDQGEEHENSIFVWCKKENMPKPELQMTEIKNLFENAYLGASIASFLNGQYINTLITAWVNNDDAVKNVKSNFSAPAGFLNSNIVPMDKIEESKYSRIILAQSLDVTLLALEVLIPYFQGEVLDSLIEMRPDITWDYVAIEDFSENSYQYTVNKKLPTVLDTFPQKWTGRATIIKSACPVDMLVTDPEGKRVGTMYKADGSVEIINEINKSVYTGSETEPEFVLLFDPIENGKYVIDMYGKENGMYNLSIISVDNGSVFYQKNFTNIFIGQGETQEYEEPIIDMESPEAIISYDSFSEELIISGEDNFDKNISVFYREKCSMYLHKICMGWERNYTLTDSVGNELVLTLKYSKVNISLSNYFSITYVQILNAKYSNKNGANITRFENNWLSYSTQKQKGDGKIELLYQTIYIKDKGFIRTVYDAKKNITIIISDFENRPKKEILRGLQIYKIATALGEGIKLINHF